MPRFRPASTRHGNGGNTLFVFLAILAVVVPTLLFLWFILQAMENEKAAQRQKQQEDVRHALNRSLEKINTHLGKIAEGKFPPLQSAGQLTPLSPFSKGGRIRRTRRPPPLRHHRRTPASQTRALHQFQQSGSKQRKGHRVDPGLFHRSRPRPSFPKVRTRLPRPIHHSRAENRHLRRRSPHLPLLFVGGHLPAQARPPPARPPHPRTQVPPPVIHRHPHLPATFFVRRTPENRPGILPART